MGPLYLSQEQEQEQEQQAASQAVDNQTESIADDAEKNGAQNPKATRTPETENAVGK